MRLSSYWEVVLLTRRLTLFRGMVRVEGLGDMPPLGCEKRLLVWGMTRNLLITNTSKRFIKMKKEKISSPKAMRTFCCWVWEEIYRVSEILFDVGNIWKKEMQVFRKRPKIANKNTSDINRYAMRLCRVGKCFTTRWKEFGWKKIKFKVGWWRIRWGKGKG